MNRQSIQGSRPRMSPDLLKVLATRFTARDRYLCQLLLDYRVLTTNQITDVAFASTITASHRLLSLYRYRVIDRFRPHRTTGSAPYHHILDDAGAAVLAAHRGITVDQLGYRRDKTLALAHNQRLDHTVGVNGFFTALIAAARRSRGTAELVEWWSERRCAAAWGDIVRPDGYGRWRHDGRDVDFFLEYDRGTEPHDRLTAKVDAYADLADLTGITTPVLFWLPTSRRETHLRHHLYRTRHTTPAVPIATAAADTAPNPADAAWLPLHDPSGGRRPLRDLAPVTTQRATPAVLLARDGRSADQPCDFQ